VNPKKNPAGLCRVRYILQRLYLAGGGGGKRAASGTIFFTGGVVLR
jgi:hypothetical protein